MYSQSLQVSNLFSSRTISGFKYLTALFILVCAGLGFGPAATAQGLTINIAGPTTCTLANTPVNYTVTLTFTKDKLGIITARDLCSCRYLFFSTRDANGNSMGDMTIGGQNFGDLAVFTETNCAIDPFITGNQVGDGINSIMYYQNSGGTSLVWSYNVSVVWKVPAGSAIGGTLSVAYKCSGDLETKIGKVTLTSINAQKSITTELFPRQPTLSTAPVDCHQVRLNMTALGTLFCPSIGNVGFQVDESFDGGTTWTTVLPFLQGVPRSVNYSPLSHPEYTRTFRVRMYAAVNGGTLFSSYSNLAYATIDNTPTILSGPSVISNAPTTAWYSINGSSNTNVFSFGGTGGGVNVSFLTPTNSSSVNVNVPATHTGGYFTVEATGTATCGNPYHITQGTYVTPSFAGDGSDRDEATITTEEASDMNAIYHDGNLDISTSLKGAKQVTIVGMDGRIMLNTNFDTSNFSVQIGDSNYKSGIYSVNVTCKDKQLSKKFVVAD
ncbi:T9SS type A sorting domain-containing protein [Runella sp.]|uniref:T9SS type A sorting domain-containing protein n=1 Tax=Runella sp. TaxID=1960881 RepID=UPI0030165C80